MMADQYIANRLDQYIGWYDNLVERCEAQIAAENAATLNVMAVAKQEASIAAEQKAAVQD